MHHLLEHINQDMKRIKSKDKDSTVHKTVYTNDFSFWFDTVNYWDGPLCMSSGVRLYLFVNKYCSFSLTLTKQCIPCRNAT